MSSRWGRRLQRAAVCLLIVTYAGLAHYSNYSGAHRLGGALALAPLTLFGLLLIWRDMPLAAAVPSTVAVGGALYLLWPLSESHFSLFYLLQESSMYGLLGATFGRSLRVGSVPLCTMLADRVHGPLSAKEVAYTRRVTAAWAIFFLVLTLISVALYITVPLRIWSFYINFSVVPLIGAMFAAEYWVRQQVLPPIEQASLWATIRVFFADSWDREHGL